MENNNGKNKISDVITSSLEGIKSMVDADTVIGTPIETPSGTVIIPISKVSVGFVGGGNDYAGKNVQASGKNNFGGAGGSGVTVKPVGFLVVNSAGDVNVLNIDNPGGTNDLGSSIQTIIDKTPDVISKIKSAFAKDKKKAKEDKNDTAEEAVNAENEKV